MNFTNGMYECEKQEQSNIILNDIIDTITLSNIIIDDYTNDISIINTIEIIDNYENNTHIINITTYPSETKIDTSTINTIEITDNYINDTIIINTIIDLSQTEIIDNYYINQSNTINLNDKTYDNILDNSSTEYLNECLIEIENINKYLTYKLIRNSINDYSNNLFYKNELLVEHYINNNNNYTITIFNSWQCTHLLLEYGYFEINTNEILSKLKNNYTDAFNNNYIFEFINYKYKNYLEIHDISGKNISKIESIFPHCLKRNNLKIINNITREINSVLGIVIAKKMIENKINPFDKDDNIFNNICNNFTIETIDIPIKERKQIIF